MTDHEAKNFFREIADFQKKIGEAFQQADDAHSRLGKIFKRIEVMQIAINDRLERIDHMNGVNEVVYAPHIAFRSAISAIEDRIVAMIKHSPERAVTMRAVARSMSAKQRKLDWRGVIDLLVDRGIVVMEERAGAGRPGLSLRMAKRQERSFVSCPTKLTSCC